MRAEEIPVTGFKVNRYTRVTNLLRIRVGYVGGFVRLPKRRITRRTDQLRWTASGMMATDCVRTLNRDRSDLSAAR